MWGLLGSYGLNKVEQNTIYNVWSKKIERECNKIRSGRMDVRCNTLTDTLFVVIVVVLDAVVTVYNCQF